MSERGLIASIVVMMVATAGVGAMIVELFARVVFGISFDPMVFVGVLFLNLIALTFWVVRKIIEKGDIGR